MKQNQRILAAAYAAAVEAGAPRGVRVNLHGPDEKPSPAWALAKMRELFPRQGVLGAGPWGEFEFATAPQWSELGTFAVMRPDAVEAVRQPLYDSLLYPTAGATQFRFFQTPQGQGLSASPGQANQTKGLSDTNMELAGQLPSPKAFLITSIETIFEPGSVSTANTFTPPLISGPNTGVITSGTIGQITPAQAQNDVQNVLQSGWLDLFLISKSYLTNSRGDSFPPKSHLAYEGSVSTGGTLQSFAIGAGARAVGRPFYVNPPVLIMPNTNFSVTWNWPSAVATPSGFNGRLIVRLDGFLYRNAQ